MGQHKWAEQAPDEDFFRILEPDGRVSGEAPDLDDETLLRMYRTLVLTRAYETVRRDHRVMQSLGEASYFLGKNEAALSWFRLYVSTVPEGARVAQSYYLMGETYLRLERYEHADIAFAAALHHTPANARWWARLGYARERKSDWTWALAAYDEALRLNPRLQEAIDGKARVAARLRR